MSSKEFQIQAMLRARNRHIPSSSSLSHLTPFEVIAQGQSSNSRLPTNGKGKEKSRSYVIWNREMDNLFAQVLYGQLALGNKSEGEWKPQAYQAVVDVLNAKLGLTLVVSNVKNRMKAWKRHYSVITNIRTRTKFKWDDDKKMVVIEIEDVVKWNEYVETFPEASGYQNRTIENWDDIVMLCGSDRATGEGVANFQDVNEEMDQEGNEVQSNINLEDQDTSRSNPQSSGRVKRVGKDPLADAVMQVANSFKEYLQSKKKLSGEEVHAVVSQIQGLQKVEVFQAVRKLIKGDPEEFNLLKSLPNDEKKEWIRFLLES